MRSKTYFLPSTLPPFFPNITGTIHRQLIPASGHPGGNGP
jgi:hypothetical protein